MCVPQFGRTHPSRFVLLSPGCDIKMNSTAWNDVQGVCYGETQTYETRNVQHQILQNCDSGVTDTRKPTPKICSPLSNERPSKWVPEICLTGISGDISKIFKTTRNTARNTLVPRTEGQQRLRVCYRRGLQKIFGPKRKWKEVNNTARSSVVIFTPRQILRWSNQEVWDWLKM